MKANKKRDMRNRNAKSKSRTNSTKEVACDEKTNDPSFYMNNPQLSRDAANFSFNLPTGAPFQLDAIYGSNYRMSVPGVARIGVQIGCGAANVQSDPVNTAATNIYSYVRHANSGHANYEQADLMMYLLAVDNLYAFYAHCVRAYGTMQTYSPLNRYLPRVLIRAMGFNFDDINQNLADFRYFINNFAVKLGSLCTPSSMSLFARHVQLFSYVYNDSTDVKGQCYVLCPDGFYKYTPIANETGGNLTLVDFKGKKDSDGVYTFADIVSYGNSLLSELMGDEDIGIISGDILKAFGTDGVMKLAMVDETYTVIPVFDGYMLSQIENATLMGYQHSTMGRDISQKSNVISYKPVFYADTLFSALDEGALGSGYRSDVIFNMHVSNPDAGLILDGSRLTVIAVSEVRQPELIWRVDCCGTEMATTLRIYQFADTSTPGSSGTWNVSVGGDIISYMPLLDNVSKYANLLRLSAFSYHPHIRKQPEAWNATNENWNLVDFDNYTTLSYSDLYKLHSTALLSQFRVPQMGAGF